MVTNISHSPAETAALGEQWGRTAHSGLVIGLFGDLGAGKTQFVKGLASGLGITERVHSPTFSLVNIYNGGRLTLFHLDLYRLDTRQQIVAAGLEDCLSPEGVTVIEWAERWLDTGQNSQSAGQSPDSRITDRQSPIANHQSPTAFRIVRIEVLSETERRISYEDSGT